MRLVEITDLNSHPDVRVYSSLTETQLRSSLKPQEALFIAESPKVIKVALEQGLEPVSLLCERRHIEGDAAEIIRMVNDIPVYTGSRQILKELTGYTLTRGVLCAMRRPVLPSLEILLEKARRIVVIDGVTDTTNIGAIFRSAAALGIEAVLLTPTSCDPLNRRAVRVSMGSTFLIPWNYLPLKDESGKAIEINSFLQRKGLKTAAMALCENSISLDDPVLKSENRLALIMGTEGDGLADKVIKNADYTVRIPMSYGVDSLNVAAAAAVAFWELRIKD